MTPNGLNPSTPANRDSVGRAYLRQYSRTPVSTESVRNVLAEAQRTLRKLSSAPGKKAARQSAETGSSSSSAAAAVAGQSKGLFPDDDASKSADAKLPDDERAHDDSRQVELDGLRAVCDSLERVLNGALANSQRSPDGLGLGLGMGSPVGSDEFVSVLMDGSGIADADADIGDAEASALAEAMLNSTNGGETSAHLDGHDPQMQALHQNLVQLSQADAHAYRSTIHGLEQRVETLTMEVDSRDAAIEALSNENSSLRRGLMRVSVKVWRAITESETQNDLIRTLEEKTGDMRVAYRDTVGDWEAERKETARAMDEDAKRMEQLQSSHDRLEQELQAVYDIANRYRETAMPNDGSKSSSKPNAHAHLMAPQSPGVVLFPTPKLGAKSASRGGADGAASSSAAALASEPAASAAVAASGAAVGEATLEAQAKDSRDTAGEPHFLEQVLSSRDLAHRSLIETQKAEAEAKVADREAEIQRLYKELAKLVSRTRPT